MEVFGTHKVAVPAQDRVRSGQQEEMAQLVHPKVVEQTGEDSTVGVGERGLANLALQDQQFVPQSQDLDVPISVTHRQQAQERDGIGAR
jgi:hypothetical protein